MTDESGAPAAAPGESAGIGARLRRARERLGFSPYQAAEKLRCDLNVIRYLESEQFAELGAPVFVRGHLRRYAELLQEPVGELLAEYEQRYGELTAAPDLTRIPVADRPRDTHRMLKLIGLILAGLLGAFVTWSVLQRPRAVPAAPVTQPEPRSGAGAATRPDAADATARAEPGAAPIVAAPSAAAADAAPAAPAAVPANEPDAARSPAAADFGAAPIRIAFAARADCWTEVYDRDGRQLFFGMLRKGMRRDVVGAPPLRLVMGNVPAVDVEVDGRPLQVPRELQRKNAAL
ncbi:MAG: DUF4115 domain-containing protein, partial [Gammaproteobacteria bacterium]|nr:DUF4115 domain-containing protein [Gammaproteobacteria bacterium]